MVIGNHPTLIVRDLVTIVFAFLLMMVLPLAMLVAMLWWYGVILGKEEFTLIEHVSGLAILLACSGVLITAVAVLRRLFILIGLIEFRYMQQLFRSFQVTSIWLAILFWVQWVLLWV